MEIGHVGDNSDERDLELQIAHLFYDSVVGESVKGDDARRPTLLQLVPQAVTQLTPEDADCRARHRATVGDVVHRAINRREVLDQPSIAIHEPAQEG